MPAKKSILESVGFNGGGAGGVGGTLGGSGGGASGVLLWLCLRDAPCRMMTREGRGRRGLGARMERRQGLPPSPPDERAFSDEPEGQRESLPGRSRLALGRRRVLGEFLGPATLEAGFRFRAPEDCTRRGPRADQRRSKYPPAKPGALSPLAPQRGLFAASQKKQTLLASNAFARRVDQEEAKRTTPGTVKLWVPPRQSRGFSQRK